MATKVYRIEEFKARKSEAECYSRVVWLGGVSGNPLVQSEPAIGVVLAAVPGHRNPLSEPDASDSTRTVRIGVGQLPYISYGSVWSADGRPVEGRLQGLKSVELTVDPARGQFASFSDLAIVHNAIPRSFYPIGRSFPVAAHTKVLALDESGDPWKVLVPVNEIIRFYYATSTRLAQAFFWGEFRRSVDASKCGPGPSGIYHVHLRKWMYNPDSWTLGRYLASETMRRQADRCFQQLQIARSDPGSRHYMPCDDYECGFPFSEPSRVRALVRELPKGRLLVLRLLKCFAPFPFTGVEFNRDNRNFHSAEADGIELPRAWIRRSLKEIPDEEDVVEGAGNRNVMHSDSEPTNFLQPLVIDAIEQRFADLREKPLLPDRSEPQQYQGAKPIPAAQPNLSGLGTGHGTSGVADRVPAVINTMSGELTPLPDVPRQAPIPFSLDGFFSAIAVVANNLSLSVRYVSSLSDPLETKPISATLCFPARSARRRSLKWPRIPDGEDGWRPRQVVVAILTREHRNVQVFEAERFDDKDKLSVLLLAKPDYSEMSADEIHEVLQLTSAKGRWIAQSNTREYIRRSATHQVSNAEDMAPRIKKELEFLLASTGDAADECEDFVFDVDQNEIPVPEPGEA